MTPENQETALQILQLETQLQQVSEQVKAQIEFYNQTKASIENLKQKLKNDTTYYNEQVNNSIFVSDFYNEEVLLKTWKEYYQRIYLKWKSKKDSK